MNLQEKWQQLKDKAEALTLRERGILTGTASVIVAFIWLQTAFADYEKQQKSFASQKQSLNQESVDQSTRLSELTESLLHDPNAILRKEQKKLNQDLLALRQEIEERMSNLIAPEAMADLMKTVLSDYKGLNLLSARNLPVEPLNISINSGNEDGDDSSENSPNGDESQAVIFTHGFEMILKGGYFQTIEFLKQLEGLNGFYWKMLSYKVDSYPEATIKIQLSTLSLEEDWIGV